MAKAEMAATKIPRSLAAWLVAAFLSALAAGPLLEFGALLRGDSEVLRPLPPGRTAAAIAEIERRFDERSFFARRIRPRLQTLLLDWFRYGNERVYRGGSGWLFLRDDFDHLTRRDAAGQPVSSVGNAPTAIAPIAALAAIADFERQLAARGIQLLVVPLPSKLSIHPQLWVASVRPPIVAPREAALHEALRSRGVETLELATLLLARARLDGAAFLRADSHWTPAAMDDAAREIAMRVRETVALPPGNRVAFQVQSSVRSGRGDLATLLEASAGASQAVTTWPTRRLEEPDAGSGAPQVLLLGDSFSAVYSRPDLGWGSDAGLAERLAYHLGLPVDRILQNAGGASETRALLAGEWAREPRRFAALRVVVWQFAAREISVGAWRLVPLPAAAADSARLNAR